MELVSNNYVFNFNIYSFHGINYVNWFVERQKITEGFFFLFQLPAEKILLYLETDTVYKYQSKIGIHDITVPSFLSLSDASKIQFF